MVPHLHLVTVSRLVMVPHLVTVSRLVMVPHLHLVTVSRLVMVPHLVTELYPHWLSLEDELYPHFLSLEKERSLKMGQGHTNPMPQSFQNLPRAARARTEHSSEMTDAANTIKACA